MIKLTYVLYANNSGYSQAAQDLVLALNRSGKYDIRVNPLLNSKFNGKEFGEDKRKVFTDMFNKKESNDRIWVYHCIPTAQRLAKTSRKNIGFATFETFEPPNSGPGNWIDTLNRNDCIVCPSEFNYNIFSHENIKKPIFYIPHCYNTSIFNQNVKKLEKRKIFTFLFFGSWRERKGYPNLIDAWCREFKAGSDVQLIIKTDKINSAKQSVGEIMRKNGFSNKEVAPIIFENNIFDETQLAQFFKSVDCLISPTLGEGFGLPGLQCMAVGTPIIITDFSGCKDYANEKTATMLKPTGFVIRQCLDNLVQFKNKKWAFVSVTEIMQKMRYVYNNYDESLEKAKFAQKFVEDRFNYEKVEGEFSEMMNSVFNV